MRMFNALELKVLPLVFLFDALMWLVSSYFFYSSSHCPGALDVHPSVLLRGIGNRVGRPSLFAVSAWTREQSQEPRSAQGKAAP